MLHLGHLDRLKQIYEYNKKFTDDEIRSGPRPKGKEVRAATYVDTKLMNCLVTGRSMPVF
jgi:hypothetical protein